MTWGKVALGSGPAGCFSALSFPWSVDFKLLVRCSQGSSLKPLSALLRKKTRGISGLGRQEAGHRDQVLSCSPAQPIKVPHSGYVV